MARGTTKRSKKDERPSVSAPSRPAATSSPSRSAAQSARQASQASQARAFQEAKARSEQVQRQIESVRNRTEQTLSRTPSALRDQVIDTVTHIEATRPNRLRDAAKKQARTKQLGALTNNKPARETRRSPDKVRAIIKCKSRPKTKKSPRRKGGGGGKRFIPWC